MPVALGAFLMAIAASLVARVLFTFGVGIVTFIGIDYFLDEAESFVMGKYGEMPDFAWQLMTLAGIDVGIKIMFAAASAYVGARLLMGAYKKMGFLPE